MLKLGFITDIHHCDPQLTSHGIVANGHLREMLADSALRSVDLLIDLGDRTTETDCFAGDHALVLEVADAFRSFRRPQIHLNGNHDLVRLTSDDNAAALGSPLGSHVVDADEFELIVWQLNPRFDELNRALAIGDGDLDWLRETLLASRKPSLILTHFPLDGGSMIANFYFEGPGEILAGYSNSAAARDLISSCGHVVACLSGHTHWNRLTTIDGIHFITLQSLTENFTTYPQPALSYATLEIDSQRRELNWTVYGADRAQFRLPLRPSGLHWRRTPPALRARFERLIASQSTELEATSATDRKALKNFRR